MKKGFRGKKKKGGYKKGESDHFGGKPKKN